MTALFVATLGGMAYSPTPSAVADQYAGAHNAVGASTWWAAGHTGGAGPSDLPVGAVLIYGDDIDAVHPTFASTTISKLPTVSPQCSASAECMHGTSTASLVAGTGVLTCPAGRGCLADDVQPDYVGIAPGATALAADGATGGYNAFSGYERLAWAIGEPQDGTLGPLSGARPSSKVVNFSYAGESLGYPLIDALADQYGVITSMGAGNNGAGSSTTDCGTYDAICVGAIDPVVVTDHADDVMTDFSGRGPTPDGRKKPDLVAVGVTQAASSTWESPGEGLWRNVSGTSYSTPQVAGAAALLMGAGITDPIAIRALLIDSARQGRASSGSAMGTQTGWQPDWGWGELDLTQAYAEREHLRFAAAKPGEPRFFTTASTQPGDRATLAWNRRATTFLGDAIPRNWNTTTSALTNLDLVERSASSCTALTSSTSAIDNVEQTRSPTGGAVIHVVRPQPTAIDGRDDEPFVLASTRATTALTTPVPQIAASLTPSTVRGGELVTLAMTVTNPSADMDATDLEVTPELPDGLTLASGDAAAQGSATLPAAGARSFTWTLRASGDGSQAVAINARATACGEDVASHASAEATVDSTGPVATISAPSGSAPPGSASLGWTAEDASGVGSFDIETSIDGAPFSTWLSGTDASGATHETASGHVYVWRVRARDKLGQLGAWTTSASLSVVGVSRPAAPAAHPPATPSGVRIVRIARLRKPTRLALTGVIAVGARGGIYVTVRLRRGASRKTLSAIASPRSGRWRLTLRVPRRHARFTRAEVTARYDADFTYSGSLARRALRLP